MCVIDEQFAQRSYGRSNIVGKKLNIFLGGKYHEFEIIGVASSGLSSLQGMLSNIMPGFMYIPISTMQQLTGRSTYDKLAVKLTDMETDISVVEAVSSALDRANNTTDGYIVNNLLSQKAQLDDILSIVTTALSLVAGISLAVSGISIMTTMLMSVTERTREIGIKRSIGATSFDICREFLAESVLLTILGSAAGTAAGLLISGIGCVIAGVPFQVNLAMIGIAALAFRRGGRAVRSLSCIQRRLPLTRWKPSECRWCERCRIQRKGRAEARLFPFILGGERLSG